MGGLDEKPSKPFGPLLCTLLCWWDDALSVPNKDGSFDGRSVMADKSSVASSSTIGTKLEQLT